MATVNLTKDTFEKTILDGEIVLVDFWAEWCGPCKMIGPIVEEIAGEMGDQAKICRLNTDDARDSAVEFGITAIPTIILFKNGEIKNKWVGLVSKDDMLDAIKEIA